MLFITVQYVTALHNFGEQVYSAIVFSHQLFTHAASFQLHG